MAEQVLLRGLQHPDAVSGARRFTRDSSARVGSCGRKWWLHPEYRFNHAAFVPAKMTPDELTDGLLGVPARLESAGVDLPAPLGLRDSPELADATGVYLGYNPLYAKETFKKQGMLFGLARDSIHPPGKARSPVLPAVEQSKMHLIDLGYCAFPGFGTESGVSTHGRG